MSLGKRSGTLRDSHHDTFISVEKPKSVEKTVVKLGDLLLQAKKEMQNKDSNNGVTFALIGSSGSGKSTMLRKVFLDDIYGQRKDKDYIVTIFTESEDSDAFVKLPKDVLIDGSGVDQDLIHFCYKTNIEYQKRFNFLILLDDCIHIRYKQMIEKMFLVMRNTNISSIVSLQYPKLIPISIRTSVYFTFLMCLNNEEGIEIAVKSWLSSYLPGRNIREKMTYYRTWTLDHKCFLMDNLNHKCYRIDSDYNCYEMELVPFESSESYVKSDKYEEIE